MQLQERINAITSLGKFLGQLTSDKPSKIKDIESNNSFYDGMILRIQQLNDKNGWFTSDNLHFSCENWHKALSEKNLSKWLSDYNFRQTNPKTIAIVMAGNIPMVGLHDFISVLISGNKALVKLSSNDNSLLPYLSEYLIDIAPGFKNLIEFTDEKLINFDAVIATGSNNTARYFDYYFGKYPNIIRKNRNSVAVLTGEESKDQLKNLSIDVFRYFGLGCRNVSKLYVPRGYDFDAFFNAVYSWKHVISHNKYMNNYDYNKAVYLMSVDKNLLDNEFLLLKESSDFSSPIAVVFYEYYDSLEELKQNVASQDENIQTVVSSSGIERQIPFGSSQSPQLWDYADNIDTLKFLINLSL